jgi:hypothetical protein
MAACDSPRSAIAFCACSSVRMVSSSSEATRAGRSWATSSGMRSSCLAGGCFVPFDVTAGRANDVDPAKARHILRRSGKPPRRYPASTAWRCPPSRTRVTAPAKAGGPSSSRRASCRRESSQSRSYVLATLRALHLDSDLPRVKDRHLSGGRGESHQERCLLFLYVTASNERGRSGSLGGPRSGTCRRARRTGVLPARTGSSPPGLPGHRDPASADNCWRDNSRGPWSRKVADSQPCGKRAPADERTESL